jgi:hypothetical protein
MVHAHAFFLRKVKHVANTLTPIGKAIKEVTKKCAKEIFDITWIISVI